MPRWASLRSGDSTAGETLRIDQLQPDGSYEKVEASPSLPMITPEEIVHWVTLGDTTGNHSLWGRQLRAWVRDELLPRSRAD